MQCSLRSAVGCVQPLSRPWPLTAACAVLLQLPEVPIREHPRFRWLLSLDGITASFRIGQLLHMNSVVIKMRSKWVEFYYRCVPGSQALPAGHLHGLALASHLQRYASCTD